MSYQAVLALLMCPLLALPAGATDPYVHGTGGGLKIILLAGEGAINSIPSSQVTPPVVEVRDLNDRPVESARVVFELPASGPGALFPGNQLVRETKTNAQGQAAASGYRMNEIPGPFVVAVKAYDGERTQAAEIRQINSLKESRPPKQSKLSQGSGSLKWILLGVAGVAGAAIGVYVATRGGDGGAAAAGITVSPGPITVGGPK
jgi:hypothetical protein